MSRPRRSAPGGAPPGERAPAPPRRHLRRPALALLGLLAGCGGPPPAPPGLAASPAPPPAGGGFVDVTDGSGIRFRNVCGGAGKEYILEVNGAGACWLDYDRDGELDLYLVNGSTIERLRAGEPGEPDRLYRGLGSGRFEDVTERAGAGLSGWGFGCVAADYDNDGWTDLYVTHFGPSVLLRNRGDGSFEDVTRAAGLDNPPWPGTPGPSWATGAAFADLDGDANLDLYVANYLDFNLADPPHDGKLVGGVALSCKWSGKTVMCGPKGLVPQRHRLYLGRGDGSFLDATEPAGIAARPAYGFAVVPFDFDDDGDVDLYVANDSVENHLWENLGGARFRELAMEAGAALNESGQAQASMGLDAQDYDGDGRIDLFFTNFAKDYNTLYRNLGGGQFMDVSFVAGVAAASLERLGWGTSFADLDADADLDLFVVNGHVYPGADDGPEGGFRQRSQVFLQDGGRFRDASGEAGPALATPRVGRGAAFADFDRDGGVDVLVTNLDDSPVLLANRLVRGHWASFELVSTSGNRDGLGARLVAELEGGRRLVRDHHTGASYLSGNALAVHFGLGRASRIERLTVRWPGGRTSEFSAIPADRSWVIHEDAGLTEGPLGRRP